ncbi:MAG: tetratricopeptide repeat protein [Bdellovibrionota bacterium]
MILLRNVIYPVLALVIFSSGCTQNQEVKSWWEYRKGVKFLTENKGEESLNSFSKSLENIPEKARALSNMGLAYQVLQNPERAEATYKSSLQLKTQDREAHFMSYFNLGTLYGLQGNIDRAIAAYQKALTISPTSKEAKTNIELLIQQQQQQDQQKKDDKQDDKKDQDKKDQDKKDQKGDQKDKKDQDKNQDQNKDKDKDKNKDENKDKPEEKKDYDSSPQYKPREFKGELHKQDVQKILGELKQQEQKIRSEYNRKGRKEEAHGKDW